MLAILRWIAAGMYWLSIRTRPFYAHIINKNGETLERFLGERSVPFKASYQAKISMLCIGIVPLVILIPLSFSHVRFMGIFFSSNDISFHNLVYVVMSI